MPQLNPAPWFAILFFSWFIFLTIIPQKVMAHTFPHEPTLPNSKKSMTEPWNWPWY
uniref:ATP synthase complex subunit 8 n=2 Tax=Macropodus TaxID=158450 RepID=A0A0A1G2C9_9TELE|nr:ATP synthase F0 subunit 8 [Macropodus opercularis]AIY51572.1 ATP synthase F0 subunit 8 [Macropodus opercularis]AJJ48701.1 ATP synthase F0 subunit 8 [Macropodus opercularis]ASL06244.1 ATP synthase F0 subunit 8 [Macropodus chinensis]